MKSYSFNINFQLSSLSIEEFPPCTNVPGSDELAIVLLPYRFFLFAIFLHEKKNSLIQYLPSQLRF